MSIKRTKPQKEKKQEHVNEPVPVYKTFKERHRLKFFKSFEEQENDELSSMAALSPIERLQYLRKIIDFSFGMHGYNPNKLPTKHSIRIKSHEKAEE
jgi:hypothetical protein